MSEYTNVEHPFIEKLREIGWQVIDKGIFLWFVIGVIGRESVFLQTQKKIIKHTHYEQDKNKELWSNPRWFR